MIRMKQEDINKKYITYKKDGPLFYNNGHSRFLNYKERFLLWIGYYSLEDL